MSPLSIGLVGILLASSVLGAECSISGRVLDERGRGVKFAIVQADWGDLPVGRPPNLRVAANERGEYCFPNLPTQVYRISATASLAPPSASPSCTTCCEPSTGFGIQAARKPVKLEPAGRIAGVNIRLRRIPVYCVRGEVRTKAGELVQRPSLALENPAVGETSGVLTEGGKFLLTNLRPGTYSLILRDLTKLGRVVASRSIRVVDRNIDGVVITAPLF